MRVHKPMPAIERLARELAASGKYHSYIQVEKAVIASGYPDARTVLPAATRSEIERIIEHVTGGVFRDAPNQPAS